MMALWALAFGVNQGLHLGLLAGDFLDDLLDVGSLCSLRTVLRTVIWTAWLTYQTFLLVDQKPQKLLFPPEMITNLPWSPHP